MISSTTPQRLPRWCLPTLVALSALAAACTSAPTPPASGTSPSASTSATGPQVQPTRPLASMDTNNTVALWLQGYFWDLQTARSASGQPVSDWQIAGRDPLRLQFHGTQVAVQNLCNVINARYVLDAAQQQLQLQRPVSTLRACSDNSLMALERRTATALPLISSYTRHEAQGSAAPRLNLHFSDGTRWELQGTPTPQTRYGSAGDRIFLEVAPQTIACQQNRQPDASGRTCLRVRDVHYNQSGIRQGLGEWRVLQERIEGYTHRPGVRTVLRLQRYDLSNQPQPRPGFRYAYVLDMTVEQEIVK